MPFSFIFPHTLITFFILLGPGRYTPFFFIFSATLLINNFPIDFLKLFFLNFAYSL